MTLRRHLAAMSLFLTVGSTGVWAQTTPLAIGNSVSLDGLTATISALSCPANGCTAGDVLEVQETSRGNLVFEVINSTSTSSIFASTGLAETLGFSLTISPTAGYTHALGNVSSVTQTAIGWQHYSSCTSNCSGSSAIATTTFTTAVATTPLVSTLDIQPKNTTASQQTVIGVADNLTTPTDAFTISSSLSLSPNGNTVDRLEFNALALRLHTVPEPASASVLLFSLGGLLIARRRRRPR